MQNDIPLAKQVQDLLVFLVEYYKNPIAKIKAPPYLDWHQVVILQIIVAAFSGFFNGLVSANIIFIFWGLLIFPLVAAGLSFIAALFLHYSIQIFFKREIALLDVYKMVVLANLPFLLIRIASPVLQSLDIVGFIITAFLLSVGFIERHRLEKAKVIRLVSLLSLFVVITWLIQVSFSLYAEKEVFDFNQFSIHGD